jgi:hypothetical protein
MKKCAKCKQFKEIINFYRSNQTKDGLTYYCKECINKKVLEYQKKNPDKVKEYKDNWIKNNKEKNNLIKKEYRAKNKDELIQKNKIYRSKNPEKWRKYYRERASLYRVNNPEKIKVISKKRYEKNKLSCSMSSMIRYSLKGTKKYKTWQSLLGYTLRDLKQHIEKLFKDNMSWDNYGKSGWEIDHIIPLNFFKFNNYYDTEFKLCWCLGNLRPLWSFENIAKKDKIVLSEIGRVRLTNEI